MNHSIRAALRLIEKLNFSDTEEWQLRWLPESQYLEQERANDFRSEYIDGEMLAIYGGSLRHSALAASFSTIVNSQRADRGCKAITSEVSRAYLYPDVSVVCGKAQSRTVVPTS